jgi:hypothetical protein
MRSPAFELRQADVAAVQALFDAVDRTGKLAKLPDLSVAEVFALGALAHPLIDAAALRWWNAQPDQAATALRGYDQLARRGMIDPATGRIHPQLGVILAGRARPAFILVIRATPDGDPAPGRFLGIADQVAGLRAVLGETRAPLGEALAPLGKALAPAEREETGLVYSYELIGPAQAAGLLAALTAKRNGVVLDLYLPGSRTGLPSRRLAITRDPRGLRAELAAPSVPPRQVRCSPDELTDLLLDTMKEACR